MLLDYCEIPLEDYYDMLRIIYKKNQDREINSLEEWAQAHLDALLHLGVDHHKAACGAYITNSVEGLPPLDALDYAISQGIDEDVANLGLRLGAARYTDNPNRINNLDFNATIVAEASGYNDVNCSSSSNWENRFDWNLKCKCELDVRAFAASSWKHKFHLNMGLTGKENIEETIDYVVFNGGTEEQGICVGFHEADFLGLYVSSAVGMVVEASSFACIDEGNAQEWAEKYAQQQYSWYNP